MNDLEAPLLCELPKVVELGFGMLIDGGNSQVQRCALQDCFSWAALPARQRITRPQRQRQIERQVLGLPQALR